MNTCKIKTPDVLWSECWKINY